MRARELTAGSAPLLALIAAAALAAACGLAGNEAQPEGEVTATQVATPTAATPPEEALRLFVQRRLSQGFVPDCDDARRPQDVGKQCARFRGERDGLVAYELGPTFAEYTRLLILERAGDTWTIARLENRDPNLPPVPGIPWPLRVGASVVVAGSGDCLQVRDQPGLQAAPVDCLDDGTTATVSAGPVERDGFEWWRLEGYGWAAGNWLRYPEEAETGPTATPRE